MLRGLQSLSRVQRQVIFFLIFGGILMALIAVTVLLMAGAVNSDRPVAAAVLPGAAVGQFAELPDPDAYPASVAAWDGGVFTGSYATGAIWYVDAEGRVRELDGTRDGIGAVAGLDVGRDGTLYVVDAGDTDTRTPGGDVKRVVSGAAVSSFATIGDARGFVAPDDVAVDAGGRVYVSDRGRNEIWRFEADGTGGALWWAPPPAGEGQASAVTGLAYDAERDALLVTDPERNIIYRVALADAAHEVVYESPANAENPPGFDGITVAPGGTIYVAALGQNTVLAIDGTRVDTLARGFRGAADVDYADDGRLFVANWDQSSLALPLVQPRLPFGIDVIALQP